ncbi:MAG: hypothetical protein DRI69_03980 [Bacteroidetes bacterium]|nr:MAG: hypothetical protein DRI69_03980 [Bacteroidota bacterium]
MLEYHEPIIRFGRGGGISGLKSEHILLHDGRIFRLDPVTDSLSYTGRAANKKTNIAFSDFEHFSQNPLNSPGELYYYISHESDGNESHLVWGDRNVKIDPAITEYWNRLNSLTKTR